MVSIQPGPQSNISNPDADRPRFQRAQLRLILSSLWIVFAIVLSATPVKAGANLLANPDFPDQNLDPWDVDDNGKIYWSAYDVQDEPGSGSLLLEDTVGYFVPFAFSECVPVTGNAEVTASGFFRRGTVNLSSARVEVRVAFYSSAACVPARETWIGEIKTGLLIPTSSWSPIVLDGVAPSGAAGMRMLIKASSGDGGATFFEFHGDDLSLSHTGQISISSVFADNFDDGLLDTWSGVVGN